MFNNTSSIRKFQDLQLLKSQFSHIPSLQIEKTVPFYGPKMGQSPIQHCFLGMDGVTNGETFEGVRLVESHFQHIQNLKILIHWCLDQQRNRSNQVASHVLSAGLASCPLAHWRIAAHGQLRGRFWSTGIPGRDLMAQFSWTAGFTEL